MNASDFSRRGFFHRIAIGAAIASAALSVTVTRRILLPRPDPLPFPRCPMPSTHWNPTSTPNDGDTPR